jgi:prevent-host-death family protein
MNTVDVFSARDLRNHAGGLLKDAEEGRLSVITKHGRPAAIAVPFDSRLLELGTHRHLAVQLYAQRLLTLAQAAKLSDLPIEQFIDVLGASGVNVVDYPPEEIRTELEALR